MIRYALISVSDKTQLIPFAQGLIELGITILSTGGTAQILQDAGISATQVSDYTGFPEILAGRVKTLHPKIHAGILARRDHVEDQAVLQQQHIVPIDLLIVNLYPFADTIAQKECDLAQAIEKIDIGGPALLRAGAKNHQDVTVVVDPSDYMPLLQQLKQNPQAPAADVATRLALAQKAFAYTSAYDRMIADYLALSFEKSPQKICPEFEKQRVYPSILSLNYSLVSTLRYGENPHQSAAFYRDQNFNSTDALFANYHQLQGQALSYNNLVDADAAWECVCAFETPCCVIVKHGNPCGVALADQIHIAYQHAFATDTISAFGGIIACNRAVDEILAAQLLKQFSELVIAPAFSEKALALLAQKPKMRILQIDLQLMLGPWHLKQVHGGLLVQTPDNFLPLPTLENVSKRQATLAQQQQALSAWRVVQSVKSNAIVFWNHGQTLGIGAGQMSRLDSVEIAINKAARAGLSLDGAIVASDAFFPFTDAIEAAVAAGAIVVIHPGGSINDQAIIEYANQKNIVMLCTGIRHFKH